MFWLMRHLSPGWRRAIVYVFVALVLVIAVVEAITGDLGAALAITAFAAGISAFHELAQWLIRRDPLWARRPTEPGTGMR